ncbi:MAG: phosphate ABC transporter permease subunit PstC, partial [Oscillospiraceae bacterium]
MTKKIKNVIEKIMNFFFTFCGFTSVAAVLLITVYMVVSGLPAIREIGFFNFFFGTVWQSTAETPKFGILPFVLTSVYGTIGAVIIGVPLGLLCAVYLSKMANPRVANIVRPAISLLAGIP